jgi:PncC family amidohydrolase
LAAAGRRIVFAESCTAGLASATLAGVPGISRWHCGSAVTYREQTKIDWLGVSERDVTELGAVSEPVARQMACGVLQRTPEADVAAAITGHLGPQAPGDLDGVIYVAVAHRDAEIQLHVWRHQLASSGRSERQQEAASLLLEHVRQQIAS